MISFQMNKVIEKSREMPNARERTEWNTFKFICRRYNLPFPVAHLLPRTLSPEMEKPHTRYTLNSDIDCRMESRRHFLFFAPLFSICLLMYLHGTALCSGIAISKCIFYCTAGCTNCIQRWKAKEIQRKDTQINEYILI